MPHISYSVSHASRNSAEIYVSQTDNRLLDGSVAQCDSEAPVDWTDGTGSQSRDAQLTRQRLNGGGALQSAGDDGASVRFAEQNLVRGEACVVRRQIHVESEARVLVRPAHRHFRKCDG